MLLFLILLSEEKHKAMFTALIEIKVPFLTTSFSHRTWQTLAVARFIPKHTSIHLYL